MLNKKLLIHPVIFLLGISFVYSHCPLCVVGAAALAGGASILGVSNSAIGVFLGGFAVAMGWWIANSLKKQFIPYQKPILIVVSYLTTIIPLKPLLKDLHGTYIPFLGEYGTTLSLDYFLIGSVIGGVIVCITPYLSKKITQLRKGKQIHFQGIILTFVLLLVAGVIMQFGVL